VKPSMAFEPVMGAASSHVRLRANRTLSGHRRMTESDPEQTFADPGNSRVAQDMRRVDIETAAA
jgi:hypothetical protein